MVSFKNQCIALRAHGFSLNQIVQKTKRSKTSVYFHIKKFPLSENRKQEIRLARIKRFNDYSLSIKRKSRLDRHPVIFTGWNQNTVLLISHMIFDGTINKNGCVYTNRNTVLHSQVMLGMKELYPFSPKKYESVPGVFKTAYHNVELGAYLKLKAEELIENITQMKKELRRVFLRSFFDDEGSVYFIGKRRAVRGYQHNIKILNLIKKLLTGFNINSRVGEKFNEVTITRFENIDRFAREVNFTEGVMINGNRSNSVWKKSLEKRLILKKALASYQA
ncbi:MAG: hypothetical protein A3C06_03665 [Candidatus Taylorbacteria bacterium RIFCSPHIGHO2_02_FULL_46_13]|uniref:Homing endonuclease LAGLIDADG domain-containing protein n=1 Tax=Candidatus Taylorbacteria bacterium RIFCSPHIGHO2_02_FULL_46_13 TaxID=1802312 RepID=A0A1G2MR27_9BACT|nr:MAG: hypothetical protein A3C06_03665 [Candidatus Taylorbacteria bacterium RIFCSPHIGHO2_02_FULL_46_13]